jgi:general secretion pathway protein A
MYLEHYKLHIKPFQITTDPKFLWLGENHREALAVLKYGIMDNRGLVLLTGDVGIGKTTLINALIESLGDDVVVAIVPDPDLGLIDFLTFIARSFGINDKITSKGEFLLHFNNFLKNIFQNNKKALLIIDESQKLSHETLEEIRLLSNIEHRDTKLINIFLVGQNEFNDILWEERNRALRQRITIRYGVRPLNNTDTFDYIDHRLKIAGSQKPIFTRNAIREIISFTDGFPRTINIICDHALLTGYVKGLTKISAKIIKECANDLKIPQPMAKKEPYPGKTESKNGLQSKGLLKGAAYASIITIVLLVASSFFTGKNSNSLLFTFDQIWNRITSSSPGEKPRKKMSGPPAATVQPDGKIAEETSLHTIKKPATVRKNHTRLPLDNKGVKAAANTQASSNQIDIKQKKDSTPEKIPKKMIIYFSHNSNEFSQEAIALLDQAALILNKNPKQLASAVGYTDASGVYSYNKSLSRFRANIVKSYLIGKGVDSGQIKCIGMGSDQPKDNNDTSRGRKNNRRVEIVFN